MDPQAHTVRDADFERPGVDDDRRRESTDAGRSIDSLPAFTVPDSAETDVSDRPTVLRHSS
jgi:hypothetical protein